MTKDTNKYEIKYMNFLGEFEKVYLFAEDLTDAYNKFAERFGNLRIAEIINLGKKELVK